MTGVHPPRVSVPRLKTSRQRCRQSVVSLPRTANRGRPWTETSEVSNFSIEPLASEPSVAAPKALVAPATLSGAKRPYSMYPTVAPLPTQRGPSGIRFDINQGARVLLPDRTQGKWRVRLRDLDTGNVLFEKREPGRLRSLLQALFRPFPRSTSGTWTLPAWPRRCWPMNTPPPAAMS